MKTIQSINNSSKQVIIKIDVLTKKGNKKKKFLKRNQKTINQFLKLFIYSSQLIKLHLSHNEHQWLFNFLSFITNYIIRCFI